MTLRPWPVIASPPGTLTREAALATEHVMVVSQSLGQPVLVRAGGASLAEQTRAGVFNRLNWERLKPVAGEGLVDSNASPVLLWTPATHDVEGFGSGSIGSQADSMKAVSDAYERWVNRVMNWVRRRGTPVWGLKAEGTRPDLNIRRTDVTTVHALPDALSALEAGTLGH